MKIRHWILLVGSILAVLGGVVGHVSTLPFVLISAGGGMAGIWASEGERAHAKERGIELDPL